MLKIGVPAILFLLILGIWVRDAESGFLDYYKGDFKGALTDLMQKGNEGDAHAAYLVGRIYAAGKTGTHDSDLALEWYGKAASHGSIAAPFSFLHHELQSRDRRSSFCADYEDVVRLSAKVRSIYAYIFLFTYHSRGVCNAPNMVKSVYYLHLATSFDRAFGNNRDRLAGQLSEAQRQRLDELLQQEVMPISEQEFLSHFAKTVRR